MFWRWKRDENVNTKKGVRSLRKISQMLVLPASLAEADLENIQPFLAEELLLSNFDQGR
jgi:hypothetical protein